MFEENRKNLNELWNSLSEEERETFGWDIHKLNPNTKSFEPQLKSVKSKIEKIRAIQSKCNLYGTMYVYTYNTGYSKGEITFEKHSLKFLKSSALNGLYKLVCEGAK